MARRHRKYPTNSIIRLARFHHTVCPFIIMLLIAFRRSWLAGIAMILYSLWTLIGYLLRWRHIYCSYQIGSRQPMTPYSIDWYDVREIDAFGIPAIFTALGVALIVVSFWM